MDYIQRLLDSFAQYWSRKVHNIFSNYDYKDHRMVVINKNTEERDSIQVKVYLETFDKGTQAIVDKDYQTAISSFKSCVDDILKTISKQAQRDPQIKSKIHIAYYQVCQIIAGSIGLKPDRKPFTDEEKAALKRSLEYLMEALDLDPLNKTYQDLYRIVTVYLCFYEASAEECVKMLQRLLLVQPYSLLAQYNVAYNYQRLNLFDRAIPHYKLCLDILSKDEEYALELAKNNDNKDKGEYDNEQRKLFRIKCFNGLGSIYFFVQNKELSKYYFEQAYNLDPEDPDINNQMAVVYTDLRLSEQAIYHYKKGIENYKKAHISNDSNLLIASMYMNMGLMYTYTGDIFQGIEYYNESLKYKPGYSLAYQNKLLDINYLSHKVDPEYISKLHKQIDKCYNIVYKSYHDAPHLSNYRFKNPEKQKLNIGFMSGDFICHPVSYFTAGILDNLDQSKFDIYCYSTKVIKVDDRYPRCKWYCVKGVNTDKIIDLMVNTHKIDILVDLSGNTGDNRMDVLAKKPAPMIISMIGYPNTTGLSSVDYKLTDWYADPHEAEKYYSERLLRMKTGSFLCYSPNMIRDTRQPLEEQLEILPKLIPKKGNTVTFGCFNRFNKLSDLTINTWCEILHRIPNSRLVLKTKEFASEEITNRLLALIDGYEQLTGNSISNRIELFNYKDGYEEHLLDYNELDVALDTFPYAGTTTTCEALMMGVPVVTLRDTKTHVHAQNVGYSLLSNCGISEYVASTKEEYIQKCVDLVKSGIPEKTDIRAKFTTSPVYDKREYIKEFERLLVEGYNELNVEQ